ncbi:RNA polymerase sigma-54 factor [bacterium]|nr:MAG: RNA polymerase sigma-54 factor [bacterium]
MIRHGQFLSQKQTLSQKLSPQQIQYIKLLQLPTLALEQRIKEEIELNPILEEAEDFDEMPDIQEAVSDENPELANERENESESEERLEDIEPLEDISKLDDDDWDEFLHADELESYKAPLNPDLEDIRELPKPYHESLLEELENQVQLLNLNERELLISDQILGSLDSDGYFRRDVQAVIDTIAFNHQKLVTEDEVEWVLKKIQRLDPPGIAARDLRECLLIQLELQKDELDGAELAIEILKNDWDAFEKKHYSKLIQKYKVDEDELNQAYTCIRSLDPKPGLVESAGMSSNEYVIPDFHVVYLPSDDETEDGEFEITLNQRNAPKLRISPTYKQMWNEIKSSNKSDNHIKETQQFIKSKMDSAKWFIDSILQRQHTLMSVMQTLVAMQEDFFKSGKGLKPLILKDIADRVGMDISTISRVANGKFVQTPFGVYELKYFFNEGMKTSTGEEVANREIKDLIIKIISEEDKTKPLSDQDLVVELKKRGFPVARRTVAKYRELEKIPVARLRKEIF